MSQMTGWRRGSGGRYGKTINGTDYWIHKSKSDDGLVFWCLFFSMTKLDGPPWNYPCFDTLWEAKSAACEISKYRNYRDYFIQTHVKYWSKQNLEE